MTIFAIFVVIVLVVLGLFFINIYNNMVRNKHNISQAWSNIDVLLKQRHDELPKLVEVCKQYMQYEGETLEKIIQARSAVSQAREKGDIDALGKAETRLRSGLGRLFAVAENYPELKSNSNFSHLETRISTLEDALSDRREYYNQCVNINNIRVEEFPDMIVARMFNFKKYPLLEFKEEEKSDKDVKQLFSQ